jgi:hypothetical protein
MPEHQEAQEGQQAARLSLGKHDIVRCAAYAYRGSIIFDPVGAGSFSLRKNGINRHRPATADRIRAFYSILCRIRENRD